MIGQVFQSGGSDGKLYEQRISYSLQIELSAEFGEMMLTRFLTISQFLNICFFLSPSHKIWWLFFKSVYKAHLKTTGSRSNDVPIPIFTEHSYKMPRYMRLILTNIFV